MDENLLNQQPTAEELEEEEKALADSKEEDIRNSVIEKYDLDEDIDADLVTKLTEDFIAQRKSFGKVVSQKRNWREKALTTKPKEEKKEEKVENPDIKEIERMVEERFFNRDLEELEVDDEIKESIKQLSKVENISVKEAYSNPYIQFLVSQKETENKALGSIPKRKSSVTVKQGTDAALDPNNYDLSTEAGRAEWEAAKKAKYQE